ncbi:MAG: CDP-alcohol phosphatidyltransferase family protein [Elusimicrobia bacterium]|nr:CDP-alcohol phosphatidyltransferase family protein [Elusimicrobiota bacterium]
MPSVLSKPQDSFISRYFDRRISGAITCRLVKTSVTPNQVTWVSITLGLLGTLLLLSPGTYLGFVGTLFIWFHSVLDGCDGELARLKNMQSRWGALLDFFGDNVVHVALFSALAVGLWYAEGLTHYLWLGFSADIGVIASCLFYFFNSQLSTPNSQLSLMDRLAQRDFLYLLPFLALAGKLSWLLWAAAIGAPAFFLIIVFLSLRA